MVNDNDGTKLKQRKKDASPKDSSTVVQPGKSKPAISKVQRKPIQFADLPKVKPYRLWTRFVIVVAVMIIVYFISSGEKERKFALHRETIHYRSQNLDCSPNYLAEIEQFPNCVPKRCGRFVLDNLVSQSEVDVLLELAKSGLALGGSSGGASILDLHSGALSKGKDFINVYKLPESKGIFHIEALTIYQKVKTKISQAISNQFGIDVTSIYLTHPTFFSRITNVTAKTVHDEYWHPHIDKETYNSFHYTSLLYLNDFGKDFSGGRFVFVDGQEINNNKTLSSIEPKRGRVSVFTSGAENLHYVEKVTMGTRFAITISFTCNQEFAIIESNNFSNAESNE